MNPYLKSFMKQYCEEDRSYPSPEMQACWRLEELESRLEELSDSDIAYESPLILTEEDIKYSLPEHLSSIRHIKAAIEFVEFELRDKYGIVPEVQGEKKSAIISFMPMNIYLLTSVI